MSDQYSAAEIKNFFPVFLLNEPPLFQTETR